MPTDDGVGLDEDQDVLPPGPQAAQRHPKDAIRHSHPRPRPLGREDGELLAERKILEEQVGSRGEQGADPTGYGEDADEHRERMRSRARAVNTVPTFEMALSSSCNSLQLNANGIMVRYSLRDGVGSSLPQDRSQDLPKCV